jgi:hypothetical protein
LKTTISQTPYKRYWILQIRAGRIKEISGLFSRSRIDGTPDNTEALFELLDLVESLLTACC